MPADIPVAVPEVLPIVASRILLLVHVPPPGVEARVVLFPGQTLSVPVIVDGVVLTVTIADVLQPVGNV